MKYRLGLLEWGSESPFYKSRVQSERPDHQSNIQKREKGQRRADGAERAELSSLIVEVSEGRLGGPEQRQKAVKRDEQRSSH